MDNAGTEVYDVIFRIGRRIGYLEKDLSFIENKISTLDFSRKDVYKKLSDELDFEKNNLVEIAEKIRVLKLSMLHISSEMKDIVKKEQQESVSRMVDEIPFEDFITRTELK